MTVSNLISPLMVYTDRFLIGATISMVAVTYYTTPYEVVTKLLVIPGALMSVIFPALSTSYVQDISQAVCLFYRSVKYIFIVLFPLILIIIIFAQDGINLWLGQEFAVNSTLIFQLLAIGVFTNSLAHVPFGFVQSLGRPDITAKIHMVELPFYLLSLWWLLDIFGPVGAAFGWLMRNTADALILFEASRRLASNKIVFSWRMGSTACLALLVIAGGLFIDALFIKITFSLVMLAAFSIFTWIEILEKKERAIIKDKISGLIYI